jgi:hypothetical protein
MRPEQDGQQSENGFTGFAEPHRQLAHRPQERLKKSKKLTGNRS